MATTEEVIRKVMPKAINPDAWAVAFDNAFDRFWIEEDEDKAALLAQVAHESGELGYLVENLNYSAERLVQVWPKRFPNLEFAQQYERQAHKLADYVYSDRLGNGPIESGDGWQFRGRGPIQVTGRANYQAFADAAMEPQIMLVPDALLTKTIGAMAATWFWSKNQLSFLAIDKPGDDIAEDFRTITRRINGGLQGQDARARYWRKARQVYGLKEI